MSRFDVHVEYPSLVKCVVERDDTGPAECGKGNESTLASNHSEETKVVTWMDRHDSMVNQTRHGSASRGGGGGGGKRGGGFAQEVRRRQCDGRKKGFTR